jgi:5'-3' exonuclease
MRLLLIDGNHLCGRCHAALRELRRSDGHLSGMVHGTLQSLAHVRSVLRIQFHETIVVWDGGRSKTRLELYPEYKGNRRWSKELTTEQKQEKKMYYSQLNEVRAGLTLLGMKQVQAPDVEADDLLGILAHYYKQRQIVIYSGDHDLHQCVNSRISIFHPKREVMQEKEVLELWGIPIEQIPKYKALVGDTTDNIKGLYGIGDKRAKRLLPFMTDGAMPFAAPWPSEPIDKWFKAVRDSLNIYERNLKLVTIPTNWQESFYGEDEEEKVLTQLLERPEQRSSAFLNFLRQWELQELLSQASRFL